MTRAKHMLALSLLLLGSVGVAPPAASAQAVITLQNPGWSVVGQISNVAYVATLPTNGTPCVFKRIGLGGLTANTSIKGTYAGDWIIPVVTTTTHCGETVTPLVQNGYTLKVYGEDGNDIVSGGSGVHDVTYGGWGIDWVYAPGLGGDAFGDGDNDKVYGRDHPQDRLYGGGGNDNLCQHSSTTCAVMNGQTGSDTHCGSAVSFKDIEAPNCPTCGTGY